MTDPEIESCWRAIRTLRMFRLDEAARRADLDQETCGDYLDAFIALGLLNRTGDLYHPVRRRDSQLKVTVTHLWTDIDLCRRAVKALQVFRLEEAADWAGIDAKTCAEHLEAFVQLGLLARTGDLYHPVHQGARLKLVMVTCLWDEARGIIGAPTIDEVTQ